MSKQFITWKNTREGLRLPEELKDIVYEYTYQYSFYDYESKVKLNEIYLGFIDKILATPTAQMSNKKELLITLDPNDLQYSLLYIKTLIHILNNDDITLQLIHTFSLGNIQAPIKMVKDLNTLLDTYGIQSKELFDAIFSNSLIIQYISKAQIDDIKDLLKTLYENKMVIILKNAINDQYINYKLVGHSFTPDIEGTRLYNKYIDAYNNYANSL